MEKKERVKTILLKKNTRISKINIKGKRVQWHQEMVYCMQETAYYMKNLKAVKIIMTQKKDILEDLYNIGDQLL